MVAVSQHGGACMRSCSSGALAIEAAMCPARATQAVSRSRMAESDLHSRSWRACTLQCKRVAEQHFAYCGGADQDGQRAGLKWPALRGVGTRMLAWRTPVSRCAGATLQLAKSEVPSRSLSCSGTECLASPGTTAFSALHASCRSQRSSKGLLGARNGPACCEILATAALSLRPLVADHRRQHLRRPNE